MAERDLDRRFLIYSLDIVRLVQELVSRPVARIMGYQLLRCATSVGANYQEAQGAESYADFVHKLQICLKEAREAVYWLRLIDQSKLIPSQSYARLLDESVQIRSILTKAIITAKSRQ